MAVNGATFKRSKRYAIEVVDAPVAVNVTEVRPGNPASYSLIITPYAELIKSSTLMIDAKLTKEGGSARGLTIPQSGPNEWRLDMEVMSGDLYHVDLTVTAERINGSSITAEVGRYTLGEGSVDDYRAPPKIAIPPISIVDSSTDHHASAVDEGHPPPAEVSDAAAEPSKEEAATATEEGSHTEPGDHVPAEGEGEGEEEAEANWMVVAAKVVGLNLLLIAVGYLAYRKWFRSADDELDEDTEGGDK